MAVTVDLTAEHDEIRSVARRFLEKEYPSARLRALAGSAAGWEPADWEQIAELGWPAISLPETYGGVGYGMAERCLLLEEMGRVLLPGPFLASAVLAADLVALPATVVAAGDLYAGADATGAITATNGDGGWSLSGRGGLVLDAGIAEVLIVVARLAGGVGVFAVGSGTDGVGIRPVDLVDRTRRVAAVEFSGAGAVRLDAAAGTAAGVAAALQRGTVSLAAEMVGGAQRCLDLTLDYLKARHQFGRPIGSFQALKHRCADLA